VLKLPHVAQLVRDEVLVDRGALQQHEVARRVAAKAPEARHAEEPGHHEQPDAAEVNRLGIEAEPVEPRLRPPEDFPALFGYETTHERCSEH
jgi:hypothetical protein